jgi:hypothetical protein
VETEPPDRLTVIFAAVRRVTVFGLGVWVIADALVETESIPMLIIGMVMVGVLPIDDLISSASWPRRRRDR